MNELEQNDRSTKVIWKSEIRVPTFMNTVLTQIGLFILTRLIGMQNGMQMNEVDYTLPKPPRRGFPSPRLQGDWPKFNKLNRGQNKLTVCRPFFLAVRLRHRMIKAEIEME